MPKLAGLFQFTGTFQDITAYKTRFSDKIILREKGGPTTEQVKTGPEFKRTRENSNEFGGRSRASKALGQLLHPHKPMSDHNIYASMNRILRPIQILDTITVRGERNVYFTKAPKLLEGFNLNQKNTFDSIIRNPAACEVSRTDFTARFHIPALMPKINFFTPGQYALYSFVYSLGVLPDFIYYDKNWKYQPAEKEISELPVWNRSDWFNCINGSPELELNLEYHLRKPVSDSFCLVAAIGICFGVPANGTVQQVPYVGAAKIITVV